MFGGYEFNANCNENDSENLSFPGNYGFSTVNVPKTKSRLGKRRTMEVSSQVKRDVLKIIKADSNDNLKRDKIDYSKNSFENNQFLTHPVNSSVTPQKISTLNNFQVPRKFTNEPNDCKRNLECLTQFRNENPQPLQEIKNLLSEQKLSIAPEKHSPPLLPYVSQGEKNSSEIGTVLNKSFEVAEGTTNGEVLPYCGTVSIAESVDSNQSDVGNNSSFMTAHDIYNTEKNRVQIDSLYVKTPRRGFSLLDMLASPVDPASNISLNNENENFKSILLKTPGLNPFENFKTPFRSQASIDILANEKFTPSLKNNSMTPLVKRSCLKSSLERADCEKEGKISTSEKNAIASESGQASNNIKTILPSEENKISYQSGPCGLPKLPTSSEINVKRRIFEGLGWSLPPSSFSPDIKFKSYPTEENHIKKDISSVLLTPDNTIKNNSKHFSDSEINSSEMEVDVSSVKIPVQSLQDFTPDRSIPAKDINTDKVLYNQHIVDSLNGKNDVDGIKNSSDKTVLNLDSDNKTNIERDSVKAEDLSSINNLNNIISRTSSLDVGFSSASVLQTNECEPSLIASMETTCLGSEKNEPPNYEDTEMVTVQNVPLTASRDVAKDVTVIAQVPESQKSYVNIEKPTVNTSKSDKIPDKHPKSNGDNFETFRTPSQPPIQAMALCCPTPVNKPQSNEVFVNGKPYTVLSILGRGGSSEVYQVLDAKTSKLMAMKFVNLASVEESIATGYLNEIEVLTKLQGCPSVIRMFDNEYIPESKILYVVMEKGDTDFSRLMKDIMKTKKISMSMITYYWTEMLSCVKDIHEKGIIHSDLKPANFLLVSGRLKLIDFGIASSLQGDMTSVLKDVTTGTFNYMSPEAIRNSGETRGHKITYKSDVWSLGCILYNLLYGKTPFSHLTNTWAKLAAIADPTMNVSFPAESSAPPHLLFSVRWALKKDPKERPTAGELLKLAELTPGPESKLGRQISSLLAEYISQTFPGCSVKLENENTKAKLY